jgi:Flp pilus assembly protein TadG
MRLLRALRDETGAELLEFAMMGIAFFVIVFGTMDFSRMIWLDNVVASATKDGARWAAARGATADTPATSDSVNTYVQSRLYGMSGVTVTTTWNPTDKSAGSIVTVHVQGSFQSLVGILPQNAITLQSTAQMRISR